MIQGHYGGLFPSLKKQQPENVQLVTVKHLSHTTVYLFTHKTRSDS